ncbi:hypothetical protein Nmel_007057 [Mimus melanotis]
MWKCHIFLHQLWCLFFQAFLPLNRIFMEHRLRKGVNNTEINPVFFSTDYPGTVLGHFPNSY